MGITPFPNGVSSFGIPLAGPSVPTTYGTIYYVDADNGSDGNNGKSMKRAFATVAKAYSMVTTNKDDVIVCSTNAAHALTVMLDVTKNRVHFVGLSYGANRKYGLRSRWTMGNSTTTADIALLKVTGVGCTFHNIKFDSSSTVAASDYCVADGGEYTYFENCEIYKSTNLDETGAAELLANGDSSTYVNCTIGSLVNAISGAILRPCVLLTREIITGKVARDVTFSGCNFWRKCGNTGNRFVYGANATDVERMLLFDRCLFVNAKLAAAVPAQNVAFGATQTEGEVLLWDCASMNAATAMSTTTGVFALGADAGADSTTEGAAQMGIAIQCS